MRILLFLIVAILSFHANAQRDTISLNKNWRFEIKKNTSSPDSLWGAQSLQNARTVTVPHTWNVEDGANNHYGFAVYQRSITADKKWSGKAVWLQFGAVNHSSYIYINGKKVFENVGDGFNKFSVDISPYLKYGSENTLTVVVNNDYGKNKAPYTNSFDWPNDGGIIRDVDLIITNKTAVKYVHIDPKLNLKDSSGSMDIKIALQGAASAGDKFEVTVQEENQSSNRVVYKGILQTQAGGTNEFKSSVALGRVNPWHFDFPNLYKVTVRLVKGKNAVDAVSHNIGFREIKFNNGQLYFNGEPIKMMGVEWTAGSNPDYGFAESKDIIRKHVQMMKDVNCMFSRIHFQQDDAFYDLCDRNGILLQEEIPLWGGETPSDKQFTGIAMAQLELMINNHYNHTSIFATGVGNELDGTNAATKKMVSELVAKAKSLAPNRYVSYVSNTIGDRFYNNKNFTPDAGSYGEFLMVNEYISAWREVPEATLGYFLDSIHLTYPDKPFFISEFGLCGPNFKGGDKRRLQDMVYHMAVYENKSYVQGAIYFDLTDYRTHYPGTSDNDKYRRRVHGVYNMYGNPKPSMYTLRELSSPLDVKNINRWGGKTNIVIVGNLGLPQYTVKGYKLYVSDSTSDYRKGKAYDIPTVAPGQKVYVQVEDNYDGKGIVTIVRPGGGVVSVKSLYHND